MRKWVIEPADSTTTRCQVGLRKNARGRLLGRHLVQRRHAGDVAEPARRDRLEAVLGLAAAEGEDLRAEPDEVAAHAHAERLGRPHVACLVQRDRDRDAEREQHHTQHEQHCRPPQPPGRPGRGDPRTCSTLSELRRRPVPGASAVDTRPGTSPPSPDRAAAPACARAHSSAAATSAGVAGSARQPSAAASGVLDDRGEVGKRRPPATNAATASSFAALNTAGRQPPASPAWRASRTPGNASSSSGSNVQRLRRRPRCTGAAAAGTRSGQPSASAIGSRMSGGLACAIVEPSTNVTIECTTDCGCTTTSIRS